MISVRGALLGLVALACSFQPAALGGLGDARSADGPEPDAPIPDARADASPPVDAAPIDARVIDAAPPDAPDPCYAAALPLTPAVSTAGTTSGASAYQPTCESSGTSGPEVTYRVPLPVSPAAAELLVDLEDEATFDGMIDITTVCGDPAASIACMDKTFTGQGEVAHTMVPAGVVPFVVVDGWNGYLGSYVVTATWRVLAAAGAPCDPALRTARCVDDDTVCLVGSAIPICTTVVPAVEGSDNADACKADGPYSGDLVYEGELTDGDEDWLALTAAAGHTLRMWVQDTESGCSTDPVLTLFASDNCAKPGDPVAEDHNSGLGPCPSLSYTIPVGAPGTLYIRLAPDAFTGPYILVIDDLPS
jgi:hypothetical protein